MKLYRGTKEKYKPFSKEIEKEINSGWKKILEKREVGDLKFPEELNTTITSLSRLQKLHRQYFTDNKKIAESYAKENNGSLVEIELPKEEIVKNFIIEFQNYSKRKESFEIVYLIESKNILKNKEKWNLKVYDL